MHNVKSIFAASLFLSILQGERVHETCIFALNIDKLDFDIANIKKQIEDSTYKSKFSRIRVNFNETKVQYSNTAIVKEINNL